MRHVWLAGELHPAGAAAAPPFQQVIVQVCADSCCGNYCKLQGKKELLLTCFGWRFFGAWCVRDIIISKKQSVSLEALSDCKSQPELRLSVMVKFFQPEADILDLC